MTQICEQTIMESLAESFETMAFIGLMPPAGPLDAPADAVRVSIRFNSAGSGVMEMVTSRQLGKVLAANMLGLEPEDEEAKAQAEGALKEIINVFCGAMLRHAGKQDAPSLGLPRIEPFDPEGWNDVSKTAVVLDADGIPVAISIHDAKSEWRSH